MTVQFETRAGVGQPQTISRQTGKTAHSPITGVGAVRRGVLKKIFTLFFALLQKSRLAAFKCNFEWENAYIGEVKTRCSQSYTFCKLPSMRFCDVCMYYCDAVTIMKAWITKWASCTHGSTREKSRDFAKKSMYAKLTTRLTRCHVTAWGETCVNVAGKLAWFPAQQAPGLDFWPTFSWQGCQRPCKMESKMDHWRSPRTILLVKIFIPRYSLFLPFLKEMFLVVEIEFSDFKKQNNFDKLRSRKVLWKIFRIWRLHHLWTKFNNKKKKKTSLQKEFEQGPVGYYEFLGICKRLQEKQQINVLGDLACLLMKTALSLSLIPGGRDNLNI